MKVYKYTLIPEWLADGEVLAPVELELPEGATVLRVGMQNGMLSMWALVDPFNETMVTRQFVVVGTGWDVPDSVIGHIGTVDDPPYVWHVFECVQ